MPHVKVMIHLVWSTKNRQPFLASSEVRRKVWKHIKDNAAQKGIFIDMINGYNDHCHCLVSLGIEQSLSNILRLLKGESSYWINKNGLCSSKFEWQEEYFAISVSEKILPAVRDYIRNQEDHHQIKTFSEEYDLLMKEFGLKN